MRLAYDLYDPDKSVGDAAPIILLHSLLETKASWLFVAPKIAKNTGRRVYAIDMRNHGESPCSHEYNTDVLSDDVNEFLVQHQIPRVIVVGHSLGGVVGMMLALKQPQKVEKLIVEDTPLRKPSHPSDNLLAIEMEITKKVLDLVAKCPDENSAWECLRDYLRKFSSLIKIPHKCIPKYEREVLPFKWNGKSLVAHVNMDSIFKAVKEDKLLVELSGLYEGDTLVLLGIVSDFNPCTDIVVRRHFPRATKVILEGAGHFIHHLHRNDFTKEISDYINENSNIVSKY